MLKILFFFFFTISTHFHPNTKQVGPSINPREQKNQNPGSPISAKRNSICDKHNERNLDIPSSWTSFASGNVGNQKQLARLTIKKMKNVPASMIKKRDILASNSKENTKRRQEIQFGFSTK